MSMCWSGKKNLVRMSFEMRGWRIDRMEGGGGLLFLKGKGGNA